ncbi:FliA/WhiG family RNA polymerase sigma factor [Thermosipho ferrireducens]|uniref:FliA/WhiG family RNA polymerase sigma factor n=1 Tax=Thermosipho ferrireducens TaxID=2571116 RepID=A0ABX7S6M0_9BACT|nr:FliA/WhiG family RNA polymerase sigma factor [Thermosipho ferrireducens]QTA37844.1 FliA/WhiG family RNA polymerase sigma factor [Thermosipho ferrireducens]
MINKESVVKEFLPYVKKIALDLKKNLPHNVEVDDLVQEGLLALLQAVEKYDPRKGAKLRSYILTRVRGAMYDYLRSIDWMPKNLRHNIKLVEEAILSLEKKGKEISFEKLAEETGLTKENVVRAYNEMVRKQFLRLDEYITEDLTTVDTIASDDNPEENAFKELLKEKLKEAIKKLDKKEQMVLSLRFEYELSLKEIGKILEVTESRISQIISSAIAKLKKFLGGS